MQPRDPDLKSIGILIAEIEDAAPTGDAPKLRRALSLAAEATRLPAGTQRDELVRDARRLLQEGRRS